MFVTTDYVVTQSGRYR